MSNEQNQITNESRKVEKGNLWQNVAKFLDWFAKIFFSAAAVYFAWAQMENRKQQQIISDRQSVSLWVEKMLENSQIGKSNSVVIEALATYGSSATPFLVSILKDTIDDVTENETTRALNKIASESILIELFDDRNLPDSTKLLLCTGLMEKLELNDELKIIKKLNEEHYWLTYDVVAEVILQGGSSKSISQIRSQLTNNERLPIRAKISITQKLNSYSLISNYEQDSVLLDFLEQVEDSITIVSLLQGIKKDSKDFQDVLLKSNAFDEEKKELLKDIYFSTHPERGSSLDLTKLRIEETPNGKPISEPQLLKFIVIRSTLGISLDGDIKWYTNPDSKQGVHFLVGREGNIVKLADPEKMRVWHLRSYNSNSIGIGLTNWGELKLKNGEFFAWPKNYRYKVEVEKVIESCEGKYYEAYTEKQYESLNKLLNALCEEYDIPFKITTKEDSLVNRDRLKGIYGADYFFRSREDLAGNPSCIIDWDKLENAESGIKP